MDCSIDLTVPISLIEASTDSKVYAFSFGLNAGSVILCQISEWLTVSILLTNQARGK